MADLFEQLVADYLTEKGYLCMLNVPYRKADGKQSASDIDVLARNRKPPFDVIVADCKSWADGFWGDWLVDDKSKSGVSQRQYFKALFEEQWQVGLLSKVQEEMATTEFVYTIFCTRIRSNANYEGVTKLTQRTVGENPIRVITLAEMLQETDGRLVERSKTTDAVEPTTLGRFVQLIRHSQVRIEYSG